MPSGETFDSHPTTPNANIKRGVILDAGSLVATGYVDNNEGGFLFIADGDNAKAMAWKFDLSGNLQTTTALGVDGMQQGAKVDLPISFEIFIPNFRSERTPSTEAMPLLDQFGCPTNR